MQIANCVSMTVQYPPELKIISNTLMENFIKLQADIDSTSKKWSTVQATGIAVSTLGAVTTLGMWALMADSEGLAASLATAATVAGIGGFVLKKGATIYDSRSESYYQEQIAKEFLSNGHAADLENKIKENLDKMVEIFKYFQSFFLDDQVHLGVQNLSVDGKGQNADDDPTTVVALGHIDDTATATSGIDSAIGFMSGYELDSLSGIESTFDAAKSSVAEIISMGALEGLANSVGCVLSFYEIYKFSQGSTASENILNTIKKLQNKVRCYVYIEKYFQAAEKFKQFSVTSNGKKTAKVHLRTD